MKKTPLYEKHVALKAKIIDFGGWAMPVQYTNVIDEHRTTRSAAGLFDICHMGEIEVRGPQALDLLQLVLTRNLADQTVGQVKLSALLNEEGGVIDDLTVYKMDDNFYMLVTNATPKDRDWEWINDIQQDKKFDCDLKDISDETGKLDLQGPCSEEILQKLTAADLKNMRFYHFCKSQVAGFDAIISRSGYTGEDGFEIYAPGNVIGQIWDNVMTAGIDCGLKPCGLGARDTLRLEAGMMLNGQDMDETVSPLEVPYGWIVDKSKEFVGAVALRAKQNTGIRKKLVGLEMTGRGIARHGYKVFHSEKEIGVVTSGTFSPTLNKAIGLAFIDVDCSAPDTEIEVLIRDAMTKAKVVKLPFYKRKKDNIY
ncbi:MAG TPA: glycine cleavage system aminomethyltransferase GcvT [Smithella sp.]|nr:glycine cleavage system aminomethyltransferase GcvT [Smithella sp.]MDM7986741.1 glycine cleavage system aminomethyltransferase GcvT [Smithella sp.]HNY50902.1 glycine cleavage system aminomethyltransferase GcvT [Smithella sp.]HOG90884.1 glycine cleavage system aminomethyltransferase GcvT [Smithella sp.]HOU50275.1 glycine cleavage system aminomethyltransferase GcvT [Smithella sp.]